MNTFYFTKNQNAFSGKKAQKTSEVNCKPKTSAEIIQTLKAIHTDFVNLGIRISYSEFYDRLMQYLEKNGGLTSSNEDEAELLHINSEQLRPHLINFCLEMLEELTQPLLTSKIFALSSQAKRDKLPIIVPTAIVSKQSVMESVLEYFPEYKELLGDGPGTEDFLIGFSSPIYKDSEMPELSDFPKEELIKELRVGTKTVKKIVDDEVNVSYEIAKISLIVLSGTAQYEFLLYWNGESAGAIRTECFPMEGPLLFDEIRFLTPGGYRLLQEQILKLCETLTQSTTLKR